MDINTCAAGLTDNLRIVAYYTHLVPTALALFLGFYALFKTKYSQLSVVFFIFTFSFSVWLIGDLISWGVISNYVAVYTSWSILDFVNVIFFALGAYFFGILARGKISLIEKILIFLLCVPAFIITVMGNSLTGFEQSVCEAIENDILTQYKLFAEIVSVVLIVFSFIVSWKKSDRSRRIMLSVVFSAILLFFVVFSFTEFVATVTNIYEINLYGLFVLPVFLMVMVFAITNLGIFAFRLLGTQILAYVLIIITGSQFLFLQDSAEISLSVITVGISIVISVLLLQNAKREEEARIKIESLAQKLDEFNHRQEGLIHFISHEVKGYLTKNQAVFAGIREKDYGEISPQLSKIIDIGFEDTKKGVNTVMDILSASNLKKGTTTYNMTPFDLKFSVNEVVQDLRPEAEKKGLNISVSESNDSFTIKGDSEQISKHVLRNLIDNAIKYTIKGQIDIKLEKQNNKIIFSVKDSGVGITDEDKKRLFTEGGRGKESVLVNVNSTGYGLFIAKSIVEAHKGKIWAESEGKGKGTTFYVEFLGI